MSCPGRGRQGSGGPREWGAMGLCSAGAALQRCSVGAFSKNVGQKCGTMVWWEWVELRVEIYLWGPSQRYIRPIHIFLKQHRRRKESSPNLATVPLVWNQPRVLTEERGEVRKERRGPRQYIRPPSNALLPSLNSIPPLKNNLLDNRRNGEHNLQTKSLDSKFNLGVLVKQ